MSEWLQVPLSRWEATQRNRSAVALFHQSINEPPFNQLVFEYPADEDGYGFAIVLLPSGDLIAFVNDIGNPISGTLLWRVGEANTQSLIAQVCEIGGLTESDIKWTIGQPLEYE